MDSFLDFFWLLIFWTLFVAYLIVLFQIVGDLFRDRELSGWWKAVWIFFLIVFPLITALVYLIARGRGMAERQVSAAQQAKSEADSYIRTVASQATPADQITQAKALLDSGTITQQEFDALKAKALA